jgi:peptidoglycan/xylan/chitin deacetylase (PgdA/CDA1 family)
MIKPSKFINLFYRAGLFDVLHKLWPPRLTVLAYHRIDNHCAPNFDTFKSNVSATPADFAAQMDYLRQRFNIVSSDNVSAWLKGEQSLPPHPALITFDDGYTDNFKYALPVLQARKLPAIVFLATDYIGKNIPFYWDLVAYCFHHTIRQNVDLPRFGSRQWHDEQSQRAVMMDWFGVLKKLPDDEKWAAVRQLPQALHVSVPDDAFAGLCMSWDQVRTMTANGVAMGAHTQSHPILTRVSPERARTEVQGSKARIEAELNKPVTSFAYPNGLPPDFNPALQTMLPQLGLDAAFTLVSGPARLAEVRREPMAIRRIFIGNRDTLPRFAAKVMGLPRLLGLPG